MPSPFPLPARLLRVAAVGALGLAIGVGATVAVSGLRRQSESVASVQRLDLPGQAEAAQRPDDGTARPVVAGTARAAVERFLEATARQDHATAYGLLDRAGRKRYPSLARWTRAQADRTAVSGVRVGSQRRAGGPAGAVDVTVRVAHPAAIDPFAGLVPASTVELWRARSEGGHWRVAADPVSVRAQLPSDHGAPEAVTSWVRRLLACDRQGAAGLQAVTDLYGPGDLAELPCKERGRWTVAAPQGFDAAVEPEAYVATFGPEVNSWARLVPVQGPRTRFSVVVGPLGDTWRVLGTDPVQASR